ncbi:hypothetical protein RJT34_20547 [Clitoria ternatea]|uniref:Uncharacterized protein n=1 Tax=Clitoria ternatea TaxID=43366 RepID=A0AAN9ITB9_CLITE
MDPMEWESEDVEGDDACFFVFIIILLDAVVGFHTQVFVFSVIDTTTEVKDHCDAVFGIISCYLRSLCQMVGLCLAMVGSMGKSI